MSRLITVGTLVTRASRRADLENQDRVSSAEWKSFLSEAYAELYEAVIETGARIGEKTADISTDGSASYALPSDHIETVGVGYVVSNANGEIRELCEAMAQERHSYSGLTGASEARRWSFVDGSIALYPTPPSGQTYRHTYIAQSPDLSSEADGTSVDVFCSGGERFVVWGMTLLARDKDDADISSARAHKAEALLDAVSWATKRALYSPRRVIVDDGLGSGYEAGDYWPRGR